MTREEANARRRELDQNPFHRSLTRKVANKWRIAHRDELNERRRANYEKNKEREHARQKAWRKAHPESVKASWKKWADKNRAYLHERDRIRYRDPAYREIKKQQRRELMKDPRRIARKRWKARVSYHKNKNTEVGIAWLIRNIWEPRWMQLIEEPEESIERYRRRCATRTWTYFVRWARLRGLYFDPQRIPTVKGANA